MTDPEITVTIHPETDLGVAVASARQAKRDQRRFELVKAALTGMWANHQFSLEVRRAGAESNPKSGENAFQAAINFIAIKAVQQADAVLAEMEKQP